MGYHANKGWVAHWTNIFLAMNRSCGELSQVHNHYSFAETELCERILSFVQ